VLVVRLFYTRGIDTGREVCFRFFILVREYTNEGIKAKTYGNQLLTYYLLPYKEGGMQGMVKRESNNPVYISHPVKEHGDD